MFGRRHILIEKDIYKALQKTAADRGYASTDEFIRHVLATAANAPATKQEQAEVERQLRGLGYIE